MADVAIPVRDFDAGEDAVEHYIVVADPGRATVPQADIPAEALCGWELTGSTRPVEWNDIPGKLACRVCTFAAQLGVKP